MAQFMWSFFVYSPWRTHSCHCCARWFRKSICYNLKRCSFCSHYSLLLMLCCYIVYFAILQLTLLVGRQEEHPACKNWVMRCRCGYLSRARCKCFCILSSWYHCIPKPHSFLPHLNPDWFLPLLPAYEVFPGKRGCYMGVVVVSCKLPLLLLLVVDIGKGISDFWTLAVPTVYFRCV